MAKPIYNVKITSQGKPPWEFMRNVTGRIHFEFQDKLVELSEETVARMQQIINESIKRPPSSGLLANSIKMDILNTTAGVEIGIGKIADLPIYWEVINNGGYIPPANFGFFGMNKPPIKGETGEKWTHTGSNKDFLMIPKRPISPVRYAEISSQELRDHIINEINRLTAELKRG